MALFWGRWQWPSFSWHCTVAVLSLYTISQSLPAVCACVYDKGRFFSELGTLGESGEGKERERAKDRLAEVEIIHLLAPAFKAALVHLLHLGLGY